ncbi:conserved hypothetical protein [Alteromonas infernus]
MCVFSRRLNKLTLSMLIALHQLKASVCTVFYGYIGESTLIDKEGLTYITDFSVRNSQKLCLGTAFFKKTFAFVAVY